MPSKKTTTPAGPDTKGLRVVSRSEQGFRRCGRSFGVEPTVIPLSELSDDELEMLKGERNLVAIEVDLEAKG